MVKGTPAPMGGEGTTTGLRSKVAYISGPYRASSINGIAENIFRARQYALRFWQLGYTVICPHLNTAFMDGALPDAVWLEGDLELIRRSDLVVMLPGWSRSVGARAEHELAVILGKEIIFDEKEPSPCPPSTVATGTTENP